MSSSTSSFSESSVSTSSSSSTSQGYSTSSSSSSGEWTNPFTRVGSGLTYDPFKLSIANEIWLAYEERRLALEQAGVMTKAEGDDAHKVSDWQGMQYWLETNCIYFYDYTQADVSGEFISKTTLPVFTLATFRTVAGLNANGFRRATTWTPTTNDWEADVTFSYGQIQAGDIFGPWIYVDLQAALSALKWSGIACNPTTDVKDPSIQERRKSNTTNSCAQSLLDAQTGWPATTYGVAVSGNNTFYTCSASAYRMWLGTWNCTLMRQKAQISREIPVFRKAEIDVYYRESGFNYNFVDADGLGFEKGKYLRTETLPEDRESPHESPVVTAMVGDYTSDPSSLLPITCPAGGYYGLYITSAVLLMKWVFTNSN